MPEVSFSGGGARLDALFSRPPGARLLYVLVHGAGAGMRHPFLAAIAEALAEESVATFRYEFPYMQDDRKAARSTGSAARDGAGGGSRCTEKLPRAHLHIVEGADHSFHVLKRSGRTHGEVLRELARALADWVNSLS